MITFETERKPRPRRVRHVLGLLDIIEEEGPIRTPDAADIYRRKAEDGDLHPDGEPEEPYHYRTLIGYLQDLREEVSDIHWWHEGPGHGNGIFYEVLGDVPRDAVVKKFWPKRDGQKPKHIRRK